LSNSYSDIILSVVIPVFNAEDYLHTCIQSVLDQNPSQLEIILVNDCSTDKSGEICDSFVEKNDSIKVVHNSKNSGVSIARNVGIKAAIGKYIVFLDSDDYLVGDGLAGAKTLIQEKKQPDVVVIKNFLTRREPNSFTTHELFDDSIDNCHTVEDVIKTFQESKNFYGTCWCYIVKRDVIVDNALYFTPNISFAEDQEFVAKLFCISKSFAFYKETFYCKRTSSGTLTQKLNFDTSLSCLKTVIRLCKFSQNNNFSCAKKEFLHARIQSPLAQFIPQLISLNRNEIFQLSKIIEKNRISFKLLENESRYFDLFFFIKTFSPHVGLLLYKQSVIEEIIRLIEEIGGKELYVFSKNLSGKAIAQLIRKEGYPVRGILDNDETTAGTFFSTFEVNTPSILRSRPKDELAKISVLICNQHKNSVDSIYEQLQNIGLETKRITHKLFHPNGATI
jgi:glycosyltransferase involved in cell wall biosynthesis